MKNDRGDEVIIRLQDGVTNLCEFKEYTYTERGNQVTSCWIEIPETETPFQVHFGRDKTQRKNAVEVGVFCDGDLKNVVWMNETDEWRYTDCEQDADDPEKGYTLKFSKIHTEDGDDKPLLELAEGFGKIEVKFCSGFLKENSEPPPKRSARSQSGKQRMKKIYPKKTGLQFSHEIGVGDECLDDTINWMEKFEGDWENPQRNKFVFRYGSRKLLQSKNIIASSPPSERVPAGDPSKQPSWKTRLSLSKLELDSLTPEGRQTREELLNQALLECSEAQHRSNKRKAQDEPSKIDTWVQSVDESSGAFQNQAGSSKGQGKKRVKRETQNQIIQTDHQFRGKAVERRETNGRLVLDYTKCL